MNFGEDRIQPLTLAKAYEFILQDIPLICPLSLKFRSSCGILHYFDSLSRMLPLFSYSLTHPSTGM